MTTTITLETHSWPVEIVTIDHAAERDDTVTTEQLGPHNKRVLYITSTRSLAFKELPEPETAAGSADEDPNASLMTVHAKAG